MAINLQKGQRIEIGLSGIASNLTENDIKGNKKISYIIKHLFFSFSLIIALSSCGNDIALDAEGNIDLIKEMTTSEGDINTLEQSTVLYIDASSVFIDAEESSQIYNKMKSQMYQYIETLVFIKGNQFDRIECNRQQQTLFDALESMRTNYNYANIQKAVEDICDGNCQGIIITDFEFWINGKLHDRDPYLSEPFIKWLSKGYQIDILTEPYMEGKKMKKRFYVFFTDPTNETPITNTMVKQVQNHIVVGVPQVGQCNRFTINNSDCKLQRTNGNKSSGEIDIRTTKINNHCELDLTESTWCDIKEFLMNLDDHNNVIADGTEVPIIDGLMLTSGKNYSVEKIGLTAQNISKKYLSKQEGDDSYGNECWDISDAFDIQLNDGAISIYFNKNILTPNHLYSNDIGFDGNLIYVELTVDDFNIIDYDNSIFEWETQIQRNKDTANCVSLSISNVLRDINVVPKGKTLYSIYLQTPSKE